MCDRYDPEHVCNHSDDDGRYSYEAQPGVCLWNCEKLAEALAPVLDPSMARAQLDTLFTQEYTRCKFLLSAAVDGKSRPLGEISVVKSDTCYIWAPAAPMGLTDSLPRTLFQVLFGLWTSQNLRQMPVSTPQWLQLVCHSGFTRCED